MIDKSKLNAFGMIRSVTDTMCCNKTKIHQVSEFQTVAGFIYLCFIVGFMNVVAVYAPIEQLQNVQSEKENKYFW